MKTLFLFLAGVSLVCGCSGGSETETLGDGDGDSTSTGGDSGSSGGAATGGETATGGEAASGGTQGGTGGFPPTAPIACSPDISDRMIPCGGTPASVPSQTKNFSVTGPFAAGETIALSVQASSRSGMSVQAFPEQTACDDSMTMISEVTVPNADYSCVEITLTEGTQAVRFEFVSSAVAFPTLHQVCGGCP